MSLQYATKEDVERYMREANLSGNLNLDQMAAMVNFFARGALSKLENFFYRHIHENDGTLRHGLARGCMCLCCREWQIVGEDGDTIVANAEFMSEWVAAEVAE